MNSLKELSKNFNELVAQLTDDQCMDNKDLIQKIKEGLDTKTSFNADQEAQETYKSSNRLSNGQNLIEDKQALIDFKDFQISQIINSAPVAISLIDLEFTYVFTNLAYKEWFGRKLDGTKVYDFVSEDHFNKEAKVNLTTAFQGEVVNKYVDIVIDERLFPFMITHAPAQNINGEIIGAYVFAIDISVQRNIQNSLIDKNEELQKYINSYLQLEKFSHLASHDLKAPLKNIISFSSLLEIKAKDKLTENELKYLYHIKKGAKNMNDTIKGLMDFSLVSNQSPVFKNFSPKKMMSSLLKDISETIHESSTEIIVGDLPEYIYADEILIRQLFQNLLLNAIKFQSSNKPNISISSKDLEDKVWFYVKDNGIGIEQKFLENIFIVFNRLHNKEEYEGSGIGLALCKKIVEHHNGELNVISEVNKGSTFYFSLSKTG